MKRSVVVVLVAALAAFGACDSGPAGPGTLTVAANAPIELGAVQMTIIGKGITEVRGAAGVEVAVRLSLDTGDEQTWRVVAFAPEGGTLRLEVDVESTDTSLETLATEAVDTQGNLVGIAGIDFSVQQ